MERLPTEILALILTDVDERSILQLSLVSRSIRRFVELYIYRDVSLCLSDGTPDTRHRNLTFKGPVPFKRLHSLIEKLTDDVVASENVSILALELCAKNVECSVLSKQQQQLLSLIPCARKVSLSPPPFNLDLSHCKDLSHLELDFEYYGIFDHFCRKEWTAKYQHLCALTKLLWLPSLRKLKVTGLELPHNERPLEIPTHRHRSSSITELSLAFSLSDFSAYLHPILNAIRALTHLTLEGENSGRVQSCNEKKDKCISNIAKAVQCHMETLVSLDITVDKWNLGEVPLYFGSYFDNLRGFSKLRSLAIPAMFLHGGKSEPLHRNLPPKLEDLQLLLIVYRTPGEEKAERQHIAQQLRALAEEKPAWAPHLKRCIWWHSKILGYEVCYDFVQELSNLPGLFSDVSIDFRVFWSPTWADTPFAANAEKRFGGFAFDQSRRDYIPLRRGHWVSIPTQEN